VFREPQNGRDLPGCRGSAGQAQLSRCRACSEQLEQVVRGGDQRPFPVHVLQASQSVSGVSGNWSGGETKTGPPRGAKQQVEQGARRGAISGADGFGDCSADPSGRGNDVTAIGSRLAAAANRQGTELLARVGAQANTCGRVAGSPTGSPAATRLSTGKGGGCGSGFLPTPAMQMWCGGSWSARSEST
jgi:hypothetical protein